MRTFQHKVHYKAIEILTVKWSDTSLMHIFKETTTSEESWAVSWEQQPTNLTHKLNILLDGWESLRLSLQYFIPMRKKTYFAV